MGVDVWNDSSTRGVCESRKVGGWGNVLTGFVDMRSDLEDLLREGVEE